MRREPSVSPANPFARPDEDPGWYELVKMAVLGPTLVPIRLALVVGIAVAHNVPCLYTKATYSL